MTKSRVLILLLLLPLAIEDLLTGRLFLPWICLAGTAGFLLRLAGGDLSLPELLCSLFPGLCLLGIAHFLKAVGTGDAVLTAAIGLTAGFGLTAGILFWGAFLCAAAGIACMIFWHKPGNYRLPFAPFLLMGFFVCLSMESI